MRKKLILLMILVIAAALLMTACSTEQLKERLPGVRANAGMILASAENDDLDYEVGEVKTEEDFEDSNSEFGSLGEDVISEVESEMTGLETSKSFSTGFEGVQNNSGSSIEREFTSNYIQIDLTQDFGKDDLSSMIEEIVFLDSTENAGAQMDIGVDDDRVDIKYVNINIGEKSYESNNGEPIILSNEVFDPDDTITVKITAVVTIAKDEYIPSELNLNAVINSVNDNNGGKVSVASIDTEITDSFFEDLTAKENYSAGISEQLIENYEKEKIIDALKVSDSEMYLNFEIPEGINLDLSSVEVKPNTESTQINNFSLAEEALTSEKSRTMLDLNKILSMLQNDDTTDIMIEGDIALSSNGVITINKETNLKLKNAVLESAEMKIDNYQIDPEAVEEGFTAAEIDDIKDGLEEIEVVVEGINNPLPADVDLKVYLKDGASTKSELYEAENKLLSFNLKANSKNDQETMIIDKSQFDKFIGNDLYIGLELYSEFRFNKEEYNQKLVSVDKIKAEFNIELDTEDIE